MHRSAVLVFACFAVACGDERPDGVSGDTYKPPPVAENGCTPTRPGCACTTNGATGECKIYRVSGAYVACSIGTMTCLDGRWGQCEGAAVIATDGPGDAATTD